MKPLTQLIKKIFIFILNIFRFKKLPKFWLFKYTRPVEPPPSSPPKEEPLFEKEEEKVSCITTRRDRMMTGYRDYNDIAVDLLDLITKKDLLVGSAVLISYDEYINHHLQIAPSATPRTYHNGPINRELRNVPYFRRHNINFSQEVVWSDAKERFFRLTRDS